MSCNFQRIFHTSRTLLIALMVLCAFSIFAHADGTKTAEELAAGMPKSGVCAHRGDNACFPENTVPAFIAAVEKGAQMIEFDVKPCKTGELIIMHDATVDRTTNGTGAVADLTFDEIRALDAGIKKDAKFAGTKVPTFEEALACIPKEGVWINIHCGGKIEEIVQIVKREGRLHQAFISTTLSGIARARAVVPEILACNMSRTGNWKDPWTAEQNLKYAMQTIENKCQFLQLVPVCTACEAKLLHDNGVMINYTICNNPDKLEAVLKMGVDFPLTDNLDAILKKRAELLGETEK